MKIVKRNGAEEELDFSKTKQVIAFACNGIEGVSALDLEQQIVPQLKHNMTTKQIQKILIQMAVEKTSVEQPNWQFVASKLLVYDLYKEASLNRGYKKTFGYGDFYSLIKDLTQRGLYGDYILKHYNKDEVKELGSYIKPERDYLLNYIGLKHLSDRYAVRGFSGEVLELPQEVFMGVSMHLAMKEQDKLGWAKRMYDVLSQLKMTVATPTLSNARKPHHQLSSCFIDTVGDDLKSIYNTNTAFSQVSKMGGGINYTSALQ